MLKDKSQNFVSLSSKIKIDLAGAKLATAEIEAGADSMSKQEMYELSMKYRKKYGGQIITFEEFCGDS